MRKNPWNTDKPHKYQKNEKITVFGWTASTALIWASLVVWSVKNLPAIQETWVWSLSREDPLEKEMATHSSSLAWRIPWTKEPGGLHSVDRVGHDWSHLAHMQGKDQSTRRQKMRLQYFPCPITCCITSVKMRIIKPPYWSRSKYSDRNLSEEWHYLGTCLKHKSSALPQNHLIRSSEAGVQR